MDGQAERHTGGGERTIKHPGSHVKSCKHVKPPHPLVTFRLKYWSSGSEISPYFPRDTNATGLFGWKILIRIHSNRVNGKGRQTVLGRQRGLWQGLCLCLVQAHYMSLPMTGKPQLYNKWLQWSHHHLSYAWWNYHDGLKSVPESERTVISPLKCLRNLRSPRALSFKYKYSKKSQITELAK